MNRQLVRFVFISIIIFLMQDFAPRISFAEEEKKTIYSGTIYYNSIKPKNNKELNVQGFDLSKYGFLEIDQYIIKENEIIVFGKSKDGYKEITLLSSVDNKKIIKKYNINARFPVRNLNIALIVFTNKKLRSFLIITFLDNQSGNLIERTYTEMEILSNTNDNYISINDAEIEETNIAYSQDYESPNAYHAYADIVDLEDQNKKFPAFKKMNKIMLSDMNHDGYDDILIWSKINLSRLMKDENKDDFLFDSERLYVMYFDAENMNFGEIVPFDWN